jgi:hypothetical protein
MMRAFQILAAILILGLVGLVAVGYSMNEPRPEGVPGPAADALARSMEAAVRKDAWDRTGPDGRRSLVVLRAAPLRLGPGSRLG